MFQKKKIKYEILKKHILGSKDLKSGLEQR